MITPRGIRNNNPFNLDRNADDKWQGMSAVQSDPRFCVFDNAVYGIRAGFRDLIAAQDKHQRNTVELIIQAFAPAGENNTEAYIDSVCAYAQVKRTDVLDMHTYDNLRAVGEAIIEHENGGPWKTWYTESQMVKACVLAGVEPPRRKLIVNPQIIGSAVAATATAAQPVVETVQAQLQPLTDYSSILKHAFVVVALLGVALAAWAKLDERKKGIS